MEFKSVNKIFEASFKKNWVRPAISNYQGETLCFRDVARRMEKLHIMFEECGLEKGHKVAICSRNQANWAVAFLSTMTYGAVPVPLLHEFKSSNIHHLVNHSEAKILFVDDVIWEGLTETEMPDLHAIIQVNTFKLLYASEQRIVDAREHLNEMFGRKYPNVFTKDDINYYEDQPDELAIMVLETALPDDIIANNGLGFTLVISPVSPCPKRIFSPFCAGKESPLLMIFTLESGRITVQVVLVIFFIPIVPCFTITSPALTFISGSDEI